MQAVAASDRMSTRNGNAPFSRRQAALWNVGKARSNPGSGISAQISRACGGGSSVTNQVIIGSLTAAALLVPGLASAAEVSEHRRFAGFMILA
jgi:hypothetical protein